jgi:hypothetical protein
MNYLIYTTNPSNNFSILGYSESIPSALTQIKNHLSEFILNHEGKNKLNSVFITEQDLTNDDLLPGYYIITYQTHITVFKKLIIDQKTSNWLYPNTLIKNTKFEKIESYYIIDSKINNNLKNNLQKSAILKIDNNIESILINTLLSKNITYIKIDNQKCLEKIYNLFVNGILFEPKSTEELNYMGLYYKRFKNDYDLMKKYYLLAIEQGSDMAMFNLGYYYKKQTTDKYFKMAAEKGNTRALINLNKFF